MFFKEICICLSFAVFIATTYAQKIKIHFGKIKFDTTAKLIIDNALIRVYYEVIFVPSPPLPDYKEKAEMLLQIGSKYSRFMDYYELKMDSINDVGIKAHKKSEEIFETVRNIDSKSKMKFILIKGYPETKNTMPFENE